MYKKFFLFPLQIVSVHFHGIVAFLLLSVRYKPSMDWAGVGGDGVGCSCAVGPHLPHSPASAVLGDLLLPLISEPKHLSSSSQQGIS